MAAALIAFWARLSIHSYPGYRSGKIILAAVIASHGIVFTLILLSRIPYDRLALIIGLGAHVAWCCGLHELLRRRIRLRIAVVPFGDVKRFWSVPDVEWVPLSRPDLDDTVGCDGIVADFAFELPPQWETLLMDAVLSGKTVFQVKQLFESLTGRVQVDRLSENSFGSLIPARYYFHFRTLADFAAALMLLPIALPMLALVAVAITLERTGPVLFKQRRVGYAGRIIEVWKFRTLRPLGLDEAGSECNDDMEGRVTRVGTFLRRTRLDELPQIFNILKGEMGWIGPRPEAEHLSLRYANTIPFYRYRHAVRPGISGWAQVNQGHVIDLDEVRRKLEYDFFYIKYFSPWLDLLIVFSTIRTMLTGTGSR